MQAVVMQSYIKRLRRPKYLTTRTLPPSISLVILPKAGGKKLLGFLFFSALLTSHKHALETHCFPNIYTFLPLNTSLAIGLSGRSQGLDVKALEPLGFIPSCFQMISMPASPVSKHGDHQSPLDLLMPWSALHLLS